MKLHLFTTDATGLDLAGALPPEDRFTAVIVPENRKGTTKVAKLRELVAVPVYEHGRSRPLDDNLPMAEAGISWLYSQILAASDLCRYPRGLLNMHGGKIPEYRGANVLQWAIINGESELGVTWHEIVEEVDAGPIWAESTVPIPADATAMQMRAAMIKEGVRLFPEAWRHFQDRRTAPPRYPDLTKGRVWPQRRPENGRIEPGEPERKVQDLVRALCPPWPPASVQVDGRWHGIVAVCDVRRDGALPYRTAEGRLIGLRLSKDPE